MELSFQFLNVFGLRRGNRNGGIRRLLGPARCWFAQSGRSRLHTILSKQRFRPSPKERVRLPTRLENSSKGPQVTPMMHSCKRRFACCPVWKTMSRERWQPEKALMRVFSGACVHFRSALPRWSVFEFFRNSSANRILLSVKWNQGRCASRKNSHRASICPCRNTRPMGVSPIAGQSQ